MLRRGLAQNSGLVEGYAASVDEVSNMANDSRARFETPPSSKSRALYPRLSRPLNQSMPLLAARPPPQPSW